MKRREFILLLGSMPTAWPLCAAAQQEPASVPRVGLCGPAPVHPRHLGWTHFGEDCASRGTLTAGLSPSNYATLRKDPNNFPTLLPTLPA